MFVLLITVWYAPMEGLEVITEERTRSCVWAHVGDGEMTPQYFPENHGFHVCRIMKHGACHGVYKRLLYLSVPSI